MLDESVVRTPDGRELGVARWGDPAGSPVFVMHVWGGSRYNRHVTGEYERNGICAITYDRPGYGRSTRAPGRMIRDSADDICAIADALGIERFAAFGKSAGGPHALAVAATHPDRVTRCATVLGVAPRDAEDLDFFAGMTDEDKEDWHSTAGADDSRSGQLYLDTMAWIDSMALSDSLPPLIRDMRVQGHREALASGPGGIIDDEDMLDKAWGFDVGDVQCETQVVMARGDTTVPPGHGYWLARHLMRGHLVELDGSHTDFRGEAEEAVLAWLVDP